MEATRFSRVLAAMIVSALVGASTLGAFAAAQGDDQGGSDHHIHGDGAHSMTGNDSHDDGGDYDYDYTYEPPSEDQWYGGTIKGRIVDEDGVPVAGIGIFVYNETDAEHEYLVPYGYGETNSTGYFVITGLADGVYEIDVYTWGTEFLEWESDMVAEIKGASFDDVMLVTLPTIVLEEGIYFAGRVLDGTVTPALPVEGGTVSMWEIDVDPECLTVIGPRDRAAYPRLAGIFPVAKVGIIDEDCYYEDLPTFDDNKSWNDTMGDSGDEFSYDDEPGDFSYGWSEIDENGTFNVTGLTPGNYSLWIDPGTSELPSWFLPWYLVIMIEDDVKGAEVTLGGTTKIQGRVVGGDGKPVEDAYVSVWPSDDATWMSCDDICYGYAETNESGRFTVWDIPAGNWTVSVDPPYSGYWDWETGEWMEEDDWAPIRVALDNYDGKTKNLGDLVFPEARSLSGRITDVDGSGLLASISLWSESSHIYGWATTDQNGSYSMSGMVPGEYDAWVYVESEKSDFYGQGFYIEDIVVGEDMVFNYQMEALGTLKGIAKADNKALAGVSIGLWCEDCDGWGWAETDQNGSYTIVGLPSGSYSLWAGKDGSGYTWIYLEDIAVTEGNTTWSNLSFAPGKTLTGFVKDGNGNPLVRASVGVWGATGGWAETDSTGKYVIEGLGAGSYHAYVSAEETCTTNGCTKSLADATFEFTMPASDFAKDFTLAPAITIEGVVKLGGQPCVGCDVSIWTADGIGNCVDTGAGGAYTIPGMSPGTYRVEVYSPNWDLVWSGEKTVTANDRRIDVDEGSTTKQRVSGSVVDANGRAVANALVVALENGAVKGKASADKNGNWTMELPAGTYKLVGSSGDRSGSQAVTVASAAVPNVRISLSG